MEVYLFNKKREKDERGKKFLFFIKQFNITQHNKTIIQTQHKSNIRGKKSAKKQRKKKTNVFVPRFVILSIVQTF